MPILPAALLLVVAGAPVGQKPLGPSDWRKTNMTPIDFAKSIDAGILKVKGALGEAAYSWKFFSGASGHAKFMYRIRDRKTFRIESLWFNPVREDDFKAQRMVGKDGAFSLFTSGKGSVRLASGGELGVLPPNSNPLADWPMHFHQVMFQPYVNGRGAFKEMVTELSKKNSGFTIELDRRTIQGAKGPIAHMRMMARRTKAAAAKLGPAIIEIVAETNHWLPLAVRVDVGNKKKQNAVFIWICQWRGPFKFGNEWFKN
jgi:hypothetical protein